MPLMVPVWPLELDHVEPTPQVALRVLPAGIPLGMRGSGGRGESIDRVRNMGRTGRRCTHPRYEEKSCHCFPPSEPIRLFVAENEKIQSWPETCWLAPAAKAVWNCTTRQQSVLTESNEADRSMRNAYSSILIRRIRSSFTFSKDRRSPSSSAIRACKRDVGKRREKRRELREQGLARISARSISHSLRSRSYLRHSD
jgi:hypothetical protein